MQICTEHNFVLLIILSAQSLVNSVIGCVLVDTTFEHGIRS